MAKSNPIISIFSSRLEFVSLNVSAGLSDSLFKTVSKDASTTLIKKLDSLKNLGLDDANKLLEQVMASQLLKPDMDQVIVAINMKKPGESSERADKVNFQVNDHMEKYLTCKDWDDLEENGPDKGDEGLRTSLSTVARRSVEIGCIYPTEPCCARMVALIIVAGGWKVNLADLSHIRTFKSLLTFWRKSVGLLSNTVYCCIDIGISTY